MDTGKEVVVLGDCNIDSLKFSSAGQKELLVDLMTEKIFPHGVAQCVQGPTHNWSGQVPAGLDHIYTNNPEKLSKV